MDRQELEAKLDILRDGGIDFETREENGKMLLTVPWDKSNADKSEYLNVVSELWDIGTGTSIELKMKADLDSEEVRQAIKTLEESGAEISVSDELNSIKIIIHP